MGQGAWPSVTAFGHEAEEICVPRLRVPAINSLWGRNSYPLLDKCHSQREVAFGPGSQLPEVLPPKAVLGTLSSTTAVCAQHTDPCDFAPRHGGGNTLHATELRCGA